MKVIICIAILSLFICEYGVRQGKSLSNKEDREFERELKFLNKPPIKTFQIKSDIYDCIDIFKQPTLDHPLLRNHKIQMKPTQPQKFIGKNSTRKEGSIFWARLNGINCPQGTVPIQRTRKVDLIRYKNFSQVHANIIHARTSIALGQLVVALQPLEKTKYYGVYGDLNIYDLQLKDGQQSTSQMWIVKGPFSLQFGWMVSPILSGNSDSRLFAYGTTDYSKVGCYNYLCPGFVQVHRNVALGIQPLPTSTYGGEQRYITISVFQDKISKNWWLKYQNVLVGYWPKSLFPQLEDGASKVAWGGMVKGLSDGYSPPMGNGHYPQGDFERSCFIEQLHTFDASGNLVVPKENGMVSYSDNPKCYALKYLGNKKNWGLSLLFGGPGGKCWN